uniref:Uncharacterized protein n=1 Tax=Arundo donax TaxID=35708 RepID=A0A0A9AGW6_ARUDO
MCTSHIMMPLQQAAPVFAVLLTYSRI